MTIFSSSFQRSLLAFLKILVSHWLPKAGIYGPKVWSDQAVHGSLIDKMISKTIKVYSNLHYHFVNSEVVLVGMSVMLEMVARFVFLGWSMKFEMNLNIQRLLMWTPYIFWKKYRYLRSELSSWIGVIEDESFTVGRFDKTPSSWTFPRPGILVRSTFRFLYNEFPTKNIIGCHQETSSFIMLRDGP